MEELLCKRAGLARPLSQHGKLLDAVKTLVNALSPSLKAANQVYRYPDRSKLILIELQWVPLGVGKESRNRVLINPDHVTLLWNAILLQGVFGEPKLVIEFIRPNAKRQGMIDWAKELFFERQSLAGLGLLRQELLHFFERLPVADLFQERLSNPFADTLPQMGIGHLQGNLLKSLAAQTAALSLGDSMMAHYFSGDLQSAHEKALQVEPKNAMLQQYRNLILREYEEASGFDNLLDSLRKK
ncbi:hypothetical protein [Pseudomonas xanthosomatis]|uniref:hypothetical protein n=1 Tax=Pseudomonas xanthosomatis TaxID=2842356 RepID=UPI003513627C